MYCRICAAPQMLQRSSRKLHHTDVKVHSVKSRRLMFSRLAPPPSFDLAFRLPRPWRWAHGDPATCKLLFIILTTHVRGRMSALFAVLRIPAYPGQEACAAVTAGDSETPEAAMEAEQFLSEQNVLGWG